MIQFQDRLQYPHSITYLPLHHQILITNSFNGVIQRFQLEYSPSSSQIIRIRHLSTIGGKGSSWQFRALRGICHQPFTRHLVVCDRDHNQLHILNEDGTQCLFSIGKTNLQPTTRLGEFNQPYGIACHADGSICATDQYNHRAQLFDPRGVFVRAFGSQGDHSHQFDNPLGVCVLGCHWTSSCSSSPASSLLLIADSNHRNISVWSGDGSQHITQFFADGSPQGICIDRNGFVHVCCEITQVVQVFDPRYKFSHTHTLGSYGSFGCHNGQFNRPSGLCVDEMNTLMVVDCFNHRVQFFRDF